MSNTERAARFIIGTIRTISILNSIFLITAFGYMVEEWKIAQAPILICISCISWFIAVAVFTRWVETA